MSNSRKNTLAQNISEGESAPGVLGVGDGFVATATCCLFKTVSRLPRAICGGVASALGGGGAGWGIAALAGASPPMQGIAGVCGFFAGGMTGCSLCWCVSCKCSDARKTNHTSKAGV